LAAAFDGAVPVTVVAAMDDAVKTAHSLCPSGGTVLLSPGCASFDQYSDFEARGAHFKELVAALNPEECPR
jgi:UDP-N-acetylmuramoylalanine--D-glutamate ligase